MARLQLNAQTAPQLLPEYVKPIVFSVLLPVSLTLSRFSNTILLKQDMRGYISPQSITLFHFYLPELKPVKNVIPSTYFFNPIFQLWQHSRALAPLPDI